MSLILASPGIDWTVSDARLTDRDLEGLRGA
jgi:hypothetical protein